MDYRLSTCSIVTQCYIILYYNIISTVILVKLFNLLISCSYVPDGFRYSYIVSIPKMKDCYNKCLTCDDFRGIAISSIISKIF